MLASATRVLATAGLQPGDRLCCALSGGIDSVVLLDLLVRLKPEFRYELSAAHVHHGLSPAADEWQGAVEARCAALGVPLRIFRVEVPRASAEGLEAAARRLRHAALGAVACDWLAFGHHRDDQAETLLFRLFRGTGVRGAGAMVAVERADAGQPARIRPLLDSGRDEIAAWAHTHGLQWAEDESNADCRFARNHIRHQVLPAVKASFPGAPAALARAAAHFREAGALLDEIAVMDETACGGRLLERERLLALTDARVCNLLRFQVRRQGLAAPPSARLNEALRQIRETAPTRPLHLPLGEAACCVYRGKVWLEALAPPVPAVLSWQGAKQLPMVLPWGSGRVRLLRQTGAGIALASLQAAHEVRLATRWPGLRLRLARERPSRTFKNLCQEAGIPAWMRERLPVLEIDGAAAWVGGLGVDAAFACAPGEDGLVPEWEALSS